ncbi:hypothetical protein [Desulfogranum japonicum]|uniref:hypothetical protein n=1 Tax=Desulfogranum japonicum TaxID=231447 RepID=UPI00040D3BD8|nr:hypothetical protein [Desulfogranum japonicum]
MKRAGIQVRAVCPSCAGASIGHMTIDEMIERSLDQPCNLACPVCGMFHLSREEVKQIENSKITETKQYLELRKQVEAIGG